MDFFYSKNIYSENKYFTDTVDNLITELYTPIACLLTMLKLKIFQVRVRVFNLYP